jgi:hypothetical protein
LAWFEGARVCVCSSWACCCICVGLGWLGNGLAYLVGARLLKGVISLHMRKPPPPSPHTARVRTCVSIPITSVCTSPTSTHSRIRVGLFGDEVTRYHHSLPSQPASHLPSQPAFQKHHYPATASHPDMRIRSQHECRLSHSIGEYMQHLVEFPRTPAPASGWLEMEMGSCLRPSAPFSQHSNIAAPLHASFPRFFLFCRHWLGRRAVSVCSVYTALATQKPPRIWK